MADNPHQLLRLGAVLAALVLLALAVFVLTGGRLGGSKTVESDADLPQVASPPPPSGNTGAR